MMRLVFALLWVLALVTCVASEPPQTVPDRAAEHNRNLENALDKAERAQEAREADAGR